MVPSGMSVAIDLATLEKCLLKCSVMLFGLFVLLLSLANDIFVFV